MKLPSALIFVFGLVCIALALTGCAPIKANGTPSAVYFHANDGARCYAILNALGEPVGGNCAP